MDNNKAEVKELVISRVFSAPRQAVWKMWTQPEMIKKWWGPKNFTAPEAKINFKPGGKYLLCMRGVTAPGTPEKDFWSTGTYKEIVPMERILLTDSFADENGNQVSASYYGMPDTFPMESTVIITFEEQGEKTKMTLHYPSIKGIEGQMLKDMTQGWNESLDKMAEALTQQKTEKVT